MQERCAEAGQWAKHEVMYTSQRKALDELAMQSRAKDNSGCSYGQEQREDSSVKRRL